MEFDDRILFSGKHLMLYYYVYKYKSYTKASNNINNIYSNRALKNNVAQLEDMLNVQLIVIEGNKLIFTEFGHIIGRYAKRMHQIHNEAFESIDAHNLMEIRLACCHDFYEYYIKPVLHHYMKERPDSRLNVIVTNQYNAYKLLLKREIDLIIGIKEQKPKAGFEYQEIATAKILLAMPEDQVIAINDKKDFKRLADLRGAANDMSDPIYSIVNKNFGNRNNPLHIVFRTTNYEDLINAVRISYADYAIVGNYKLFGDLKYVDISRFFPPLPVAFISRENEAPKQAIEELIDLSRRFKIRPMGG